MIAIYSSLRSSLTNVLSPDIFVTLSLRTSEPLGAVLLTRYSGESIFLSWSILVLTPRVVASGLWVIILCKVAKVLISQKCWEIVHHGRRRTLTSGIFILSTRAEERTTQDKGRGQRQEDSGHFQRGRLSPQGKAEELRMVERSKERFQKVEIGREMRKKVEG